MSSTTRTSHKDATSELYFLKKEATQLRNQCARIALQLSSRQVLIKGMLMNVSAG
jgi:hypothetical protein